VHSLFGGLCGGGQAVGVFLFPPPPPPPPLFLFWMGQGGRDPGDTGRIRHGRLRGK